MAASVVVTIALRNQAHDLPNALASIFDQDIDSASLAVLILDDDSDDAWQQIGGHLLDDRRVVLASGHCGTPAQARNALLDLVDEHFPAARWAARLDADDVLATKASLRELTQAGDRFGSLFVLGSNCLQLEGHTFGSTNFADAATLLNRDRLIRNIEEFCTGKSNHELPSCNLLLQVRSGIRYPLVRSAEDHWLVASLAMFRADRGCVVRDPVYAIYSLQGAATRTSRQTAEWRLSRQQLWQAAMVWHGALSAGHEVLGWGQEGTVWRASNGIVKRFYPDSMTHEELIEIQLRMRKCGSAATDFAIEVGNFGELFAVSSDRNLEALTGRLTEECIRTFLIALYGAGVATSNIKRANLRLDCSGQLVFIDIGRDVVDLTVSRFLDCAARLYAVSILGWSDFELSRRETELTEEETLSSIDGFADFYRRLVMELLPNGLAQSSGVHDVFTHPDVTLLIKCCPQDADVLDAQVRHIVGSLCSSTGFGLRALLIDSYGGPYLRQYAEGDILSLTERAKKLHREGWLDAIWTFPECSQDISGLGEAWFGPPGSQFTHTVLGAPLLPQLWGFEQVCTRFVLQLDIDVLIGIGDSRHDAIGHMKMAFSDPKVWCAGFNIPKSSPGFRDYESRPEGFAPEVRMGLLDLPRILSRRPFSNPTIKGRYSLMWHRVLEQAQRLNGMLSTRGGDSSCFYVHPRNCDKSWIGLAKARDLIAQGCFPAEQADRWDLVVSDTWAYRERQEDLVFMLLGRNTPPSKLSRCIASLEAQTRQDFGMVFIDDGGRSTDVHSMHHALGKLRGRSTLIRRVEHLGYLENFRTAISLCTRAETLVVVLDQDDALMSATVVDDLWLAWSRGADLINAPMFRPEKPLKIYPVTYERIRHRGGGNVWAHLRAFRKALFEKIPSDSLSIEPDGLDCLSDFITMVPMAELADNPVALDNAYAYLHQREPYSPERKRREAQLKTWLFSQPELSRISSRGVSTLE